MDKSKGERTNCGAKTQNDYKLEHFLVCVVCGAYAYFPTYEEAEAEYIKLQNICPVCDAVGNLRYR